jgi:tRNA-specific adenosine deaminase 1
MELTMADQEDSSPWEIPSAAGPEVADEDATPRRLLSGRAYFSRLGIVRRKPARADAPPTMSKSCSDKLALKQCTSLLSSLLAFFVHPEGVYLSSLILPQTRYSRSACERSFSVQGRMKSLDGMCWGGGYKFAPFEVDTTAKEYSYSKTSIMNLTDKVAASNLAVSWSTAGLEESIVGGVLQGRKPFEIGGASLVSRRRMWMLAIEVANQLGDLYTNLQCRLAMPIYEDLKQSELLAIRNAVKKDVRSEALAGWIRSSGDDCFGI